MPLVVSKGGDRLHLMNEKRLKPETGIGRYQLVCLWKEHESRTAVLKFAIADGKV